VFLTREGSDLQREQHKPDRVSRLEAHGRHKCRPPGLHTESEPDAFDNARHCRAFRSRTTALSHQHDNAHGIQQGHAAGDQEGATVAKLRGREPAD
jgi:hypothetical protein